MKTLKQTALVLLLGAAMAVSCKQAEPTYTITSDRVTVNDVAANSPGAEVIVITTDAPYWIVTTPTWIKADPTTGVGGGNSTIVTLTVSSNYRDESTDTNPRSGLVKFSGGGTSLSIPVNQLGFTGAVDPNSLGGIPSMDEFKAFIEAVNNGRGITRWMNRSKEIELLTDLDLSEFTTWTPIGNVEKTGTGNYACKPMGGNAFTGVFNGGGYTIKNFNVNTTVPMVAEGATFGLFGVLDHATVKNLNVETNFKVNAAGLADVGVVAGIVYASRIENVKVSGKISSDGTTASGTKFAMGGIAGFAFGVTEDGQNYESWIKDCEVNAEVNIDCGSNTAAGATGVMYGGMVGFSTTPQSQTTHVNIENCVNNGTMTVKIGRCSGICPTANYSTILKDCTNNANQFNTIPDGRIGQICCNLTNYSCVIGCVNNGNLTTTGAQTTTAALVALMGHAGVYLEGGEKTVNTGTILGCNEKYLGLITANLSNFDHVSNVILSGQIGLYDAGGNHDYFPVSNANVMDYIGSISDANKEKVTNVTYVEGSGGNTPVVEPDSPDKNGDIDDLDLISDTWD